MGLLSAEPRMKRARTSFKSDKKKDRNSADYQTAAAMCIVTGACTLLCLTIIAMTLQCSVPLK